MKKKILMISVLITVFLTMIIGIWYYFGKNGNVKNLNKMEDNKTKNEYIEDLGLQADESLYEIVTEYDGRKTISIKEDIQFNVVLSGVLNHKMPDINRLEKELFDAPKYSGIWICEKSREKFIGLVNGITENSYKIDRDGYLQKENNNDKENEFDKKINKMIKSDKLFVFDITSISYIVDGVTGKVEEYPFEEMDRFAGYDYCENEHSIIFMISEALYGKVDQTEILKDIIHNVII